LGECGDDQSDAVRRSDVPAGGGAFGQRRQRLAGNDFAARSIDACRAGFGRTDSRLAEYAPERGRVQRGTELNRPEVARWRAVFAKSFILSARICAAIRRCARTDADCKNMGRTDEADVNADDHRQPEHVAAPGG
jgi:hypothetical protein